MGEATMKDEVLMRILEVLEAHAGGSLLRDLLLFQLASPSGGRSGNSVRYASYRLECSCGREIHMAVCLDDPAAAATGTDSGQAVARLRAMLNGEEPSGEGDSPVPDYLPEDI